MWRQVVEPVQYGGQRIEPGERVLLVQASANRDPRRFEDAETFDIARTSNRHVGFGYSIHYCLGAAIARLEGALGLGAFLGAVSTCIARCRHVRVGPAHPEPLAQAPAGPPRLIGWLDGIGESSVQCKLRQVGLPGTRRMKRVRLLRPLHRLGRGLAAAALACAGVRVRQPRGVQHPADRTARGAGDDPDGRARTPLVARLSPRRTNARHRTARPAALRRRGRHARSDSIDGLPAAVAEAGQGGLHDVALHPDFAHNRLVYFAYAGRNGRRYGTEIARGRLDGHRLADVEVLFRALPEIARRPSLWRTRGARRQGALVPHPR